MQFYVNYFTILQPYKKLKISNNLQRDGPMFLECRDRLLKPLDRKKKAEQKETLLLIGPVAALGMNARET